VDRKACDMYSFAIILWEVATGKIPFQGLSPMQVGIKVSKRSQTKRGLDDRVSVVRRCQV